jgi:hypothetical protein
MKKYLFLLIFGLITNFTMALPGHNTFLNPASDPVKKIVKEIAKSNIYEFTPTTGNDISKSQQNKRYEALLKTASVEELTNLATKHKNAVVRLYAFQALVLKLKDIPKEIIDQFKNDATMVDTLRGDIADKTPVNKISVTFLY